MAGCMVSVFAALAEFVVVKVLDVQYQYQVNKIPKVLPMVSIILRKNYKIPVLITETGLMPKIHARTFPARG